MLLSTSRTFLQNYTKTCFNSLLKSNTSKYFHHFPQYRSGFLGDSTLTRARHFSLEKSHVGKEFPAELFADHDFKLSSTYSQETNDNHASSPKEEVESPSYLPGESHRRTKLSKKTLKNIRSIQRLYKPPKEPSEFDLDSKTTVNFEVPLVHEDNVTLSEERYEHVKKLVENIYKSASNGVYNDALWNTYAQKLSVVSSLLHPNDICLVLHSFSKIRYKDKNLLRILLPLLIKNIASISCRGLSLIMNSLKRLEVPNYDLIDLATNEFCLNIDKANVQDIALVANSLSFFEVYHLKFWNVLYNSLLIRHHQIDPLQASLILASLAKLDIRSPLMLKILKRRLRPAVEKNELTPALLTLVFHSLPKLDFEAKYFYSSCVNSFDQMLSQGNVEVDSQSHVLFLYTSVCMMEPRLEVVEKSLKLLSEKSEHLKSYKMVKLKYVLDHLNHKYPEFVQGLSDEIKAFLTKIKDFRITKIPKKLSRWSFEVSLILKEGKVDHTKSVLFDYLYADIYIKDFNFVIKCTGPYSYYTKSTLPTKFSRIELDTFSIKGFNVGVLPYYEWNRLKTKEEKIEYLKRFGQNAALSL